MVASVIRDIVSDAIQRRMQDPRIAPLTTVTRVEVSGDLLVSKVYLSVPGSAAAEGKTLAAVRHAAGYIQRFVARELPLRQCPELRFEIDEALKEARRTLALLEENRRRYPAVFAPEGGTSAGDDAVPDPDDSEETAEAAAPEEPSE